MNGLKKKTISVLIFALPVIAGDILQQLYNTADSIIVGNYCGENALAALGVAGPIMSLVVFFIFGIGIGLTVLLSRYYGEGDKTKLREVAGTSMIAGGVFSVALGIILVFLIKPILLLLKTPEVITEDAQLYLAVVFLGLVFTFFYNFYSAAFMAIGKSYVPFLILLISSLTNVGLDILFVKSFEMGVLGAAAATVAAQAISVLFCAIWTAKRETLLFFKPRELKFKPKYLPKILSYSGASALQQTVLYIGKLMVQGGVNTLGVSVIAGYNAATKIENFILAPLNGVASAASSVMAREGKKEEQKTTFLGGMIISLIYSLVISAVIFAFAAYIIPLFISEPSKEMTESGVRYLTLMSAAYLYVPISTITQGMFRGTGNMKLTVASTFIQISLRVVFTYLLIEACGLDAVVYGTMIGWGVMVLFGGINAIMYFKNKSKPA